MSKKSWITASAFVVIAFIISCVSEPSDTLSVALPTMQLSAGETAEPNGNYNIENPSNPHYEAPHNTRVDSPYFKIKPGLRATVPAHLQPHSRLLLDDIEDRPFFDYFAWQTFIGLIWPADSNRRGVAQAEITPSEFKNYNSNNKSNPNRVPVVWETFRTVDEVLPNPPADGPPPAHPTAWDANPYQRPFLLKLTSKGKPRNLDEAFSSPLIDQNRQYVRYSLRFNKVLYEFIRQNKWYLKENLPKSPTQAALPPLLLSNGQLDSIAQPQTNTTVRQPIPGNSIETKASWRIMMTDKDTNQAQPWRKKDDLSRYFVTTAVVENPETPGVIDTVQVGLVGLHIVVKTPQFKQGIWCTFEHVDNLTAPDVPPRRASFKKDTTFYPKGFSYIPKEVVLDTIINGKDTSIIQAQTEEHRVPVEVSRIFKIPNTPVGATNNLTYDLSTQGLNTLYQKLLEGTVWQYYQLVITQWPTNPSVSFPSAFLYPRGFGPGTSDAVIAQQPAAVQQAFERAEAAAKLSYPLQAGLPIPQSGCLNSTMETYFQNPSNSLLENTSCMGCHYGAADTDFSWALKNRTWPQPYNQGRVHPEDTKNANFPANNAYYEAQ